MRRPSAPCFSSGLVPAARRARGCGCRAPPIVPRPARRGESHAVRTSHAPASSARSSPRAFPAIGFPAGDSSSSARAAGREHHVPRTLGRGRRLRSRATIASEAVVWPSLVAVSGRPRLRSSARDLLGRTGTTVGCVRLDQSTRLGRGGSSSTSRAAGEAYPVAAGLPVRVETRTRIGERPGATFSYEQYDAKGVMLAQGPIAPAIAG